MNSHDIIVIIFGAYFGIGFLLYLGCVITTFVKKLDPDRVFDPPVFLYIFMFWPFVLMDVFRDWLKERHLAAEIVRKAAVHQQSAQNSRLETEKATTGRKQPIKRKRKPKS